MISCHRLRSFLLVTSLAASLAAQDAAPQLLSRTGGKGNGTWSNAAAIERAAAAGDAHARATLGDMLVQGDQLKRDIPRAVTLLEQAARAGEATAAFRLGMLYEHGNGVVLDHALALDYFRAAAAGGMTEAFHNVGASYASGRGVRQDFVEGLAWLILAHEHHSAGEGESQLRRHLTEIKRHDLIARGEARAKQLARELASNPLTHFLPAGATVATGSDPAASRPRTLKADGIVPLPAAPEHSLNVPTLDEKPAAAGPPVTVMSINGRRLRWSSFEELQAEARRNAPPALFALGQLLLDGDQVAADVDRARVYLERGAELGSVDAAYRLADLYSHGRVVALDEKRGFSYMMMAARKGARTAIYNTGALYAKGWGTERDYTEALAWFTVAEHYGADFGAGAQIRNYLKKTAPAQIDVAKQRAAVIEAEIEAELKKQQP